MSREDQKRLLGLASERARIDALLERLDRQIGEQQARYNRYTANAIRRKDAGNKPGALGRLKLRKLAQQTMTGLEQRKPQLTNLMATLRAEEQELEVNLLLSLMPDNFQLLETARNNLYEKKRREFREQFARTDGVNLAEIAAPPEHAATLAGIRAGIENAAAEAEAQAASATAEAMSAASDPAFNRLSALASRSLLGEPTAANERALNELMARQSAPGLGAGAGAAAVSTPTRVVVPGSAASYANVVVSPRTEAAAAVAPGPHLPFMSPYPIRIGGTSRRRGGRSRKSRRSRNKTTRRLLRRR